MKRIFGLIMLAAICLVAHGEQVFKELPSGNTVEKTYIGKTLLRMAGAVINLDGGVSLGDPSRLDYLERVTVEGKKEAREAITILENYVAKENLEVLLSQQDDGDETIIYGKLSPNETIITTMIVFHRDAWNLNIVVLQGSIDSSSIYRR